MSKAEKAWLCLLLLLATALSNATNMWILLGGLICFVIISAWFIFAQ